MTDEFTSFTIIHMTYKHYPHDDQLEAHKARQREDARQALLARQRVEHKRKVDECVRKWAERTQNVLAK